MNAPACRRLILLRHGKSDWSRPVLCDHERPLTKRGRRSAAGMGRWLDTLGWTPGEVYCSDARRATETLHFLDLAADTHIEPTLYLGGPHEIGRVLGRATAEGVMVIGHNPGLEATLEVLTGEPGVLKTADAALLVARPGHGFEVEAVLRGREALTRAREAELPAELVG